MSLEEKIQLTIDNLEKAYSIGGLKESPDSKKVWIENLKILPNQIKFRNKLLGLLKLSKKTDGKENISRFLLEDKEEDKENASSFHLNEKQIVFIQSYLATKWSIYEKILEQIFQMFGKKEKDENKPKCATEDLLESTLHPNLHGVFKDEYKKYILFSYQIRNKFIHECYNNLLKKDDPLQSLKFNPEEYENFVNQKLKKTQNSKDEKAQNSKDEKAQNLKDEWNKWKDSDLDAVLEKCQSKIDEAYGALLKLGSIFFLTQKNLFLESDNVITSKEVVVKTEEPVS